MNAEAVAEDQIPEEDDKLFVVEVKVGPKWREIIPVFSYLQTHPPIPGNGKNGIASGLHQAARANGMESGT